MEGCISKGLFMKRAPICLLTVEWLAYFASKCNAVQQPRGASGSSCTARRLED